MEQPKKGPVLTYTANDKIVDAQRFVQSRFHAVAPWGQDVQPKPILAASDSTGNVAKLLAQAAFVQFGSSEKSRVSVQGGMRTAEDAVKVVETARDFKPEPAMLVYTVASPELDRVIREEAQKHDVTCVNVLDSLLAAMERRFDMKRSVDITKAKRKADYSNALDEFGDMTVFAVSDSGGDTVKAVAKAALKQFNGACVEHITMCSKVSSLEEITLIVQEAFATDSVVLFTFASPGMSRFMRMQCERLKVAYADVYQPLLITMERYLNYPPVGVPGGMDLKELEDSVSQNWEKESLQ